MIKLDNCAHGVSLLDTCRRCSRTKKSVRQYPLVCIEVRGGIADVVHKDAGVIVSIVDYDPGASEPPPREDRWGHLEVVRNGMGVCPKRRTR